jgi:hypothetical protein
VNPITQQNDEAQNDRTLKASEVSSESSSSNPSNSTGVEEKDNFLSRATALIERGFSVIPLQDAGAPDAKDPRILGYKSDGEPFHIGATRRTRKRQKAPKLRQEIKKLTELP